MLLVCLTRRTSIRVLIFSLAQQQISVESEKLNLSYPVIRLKPFDMNTPLLKNLSNTVTTVYRAFSTAGIQSAWRAIKISPHKTNDRIVGDWNDSITMA